MTRNNSRSMASMKKNLFPLRYAKEKYPRVFSSLKIKNVTLPNRIVFPPWVVNYATPEGAVSSELAYFYRRLARGGAGLIYVGAAGIAGEIPPGYEGVIRIDKDEYIPGLETLFDMIKGFGCCVALQLAHMGRQAAGPAPEVDALIAPSNVPDPVIAGKSPIYKLREMNSSDIARVRSQFVDAAYRQGRG
jgi:2,4-dienoyl-CoA reductase-like NADH-dependent reductase (Old Yellow Enzyme family)